MTAGKLESTSIQANKKKSKNMVKSIKSILGLNVARLKKTFVAATECNSKVKNLV